MVKIIKGMKMPGKRMEVAGRKPKYPFDQMAIGDALEMCKYTRPNMASALSRAKQWASRRKPKWKFAVRKVKGKVYLWRVK